MLLSGNRSRSVGPRPLAGECLERRSLPAGNVLASFFDGNLLVSGNLLNNAVEVRAAGDDLLVRGLDTTKVNGRTEVIFTGGALALNDLRAVMGGGHDLLIVRDLAIGGNALIGQGQIDTSFDAGNDQILMENVLVNGNLRLNAGGGADFVTLDGVSVLGTSELRGGGGSDHLRIIDTALGQLTLNAGSGNDLVEIDSSVIGSGALMRMGIGDDVLSILGDSVLGRGAFMDGGSGRDRLRRDVDATLIDLPVIISFEIREVVV